MMRHGPAHSAAMLAVAFGTCGCAAPIIAGITLGQISMVAGAASTATTGKGLEDHALSYATGKDCNLIEGVLRKDRKVCETPGSDATKEDFKGLFAASGAPDTHRPAAPTPEPTVPVARVETGSVAQPPPRGYLMLFFSGTPGDAPTGHIIVLPSPKPAALGGSASRI
jgi:hypothetical protein